MVLSKERRGLTKTLIGKAVELRNSIPWANPSQIVLLEDPRRPGKKKVRPVARIVIALLVLGLAAETLYLFTRPPTEVFEVVAAPPETRPTEPRVAQARRDEPRVEEKKAEEPRAVEKKVEEKKGDAPHPVVAAPPKSTAPAAAPAKSAPPPAKTPAPAKAAATPAPKGPGTLVVVTRHQGKPVTGATVRINGVSLGQTPVNTAVQPGVYTVKVDKPGFKVEKRADVAVTSSKKSVVTVDLKK